MPTEEYTDRTIDRCGTYWNRTPLINGVNNQPYYKAVKCYCNVDYDGAGYTFSDEYGECTFCTDELVEWGDIPGYEDFFSPTHKNQNSLP